MLLKGCQTTALLGLIAALFGLVLPVPALGQNNSMPNRFELEYSGSALLSGTRRVAVLDGFMFAAQMSGLQVHDLSDPGAPARLWQQYAGARVWDLAVAGDYLYIDMGENGITAYSVLNRTSPVMLGSIGIEGVGRRLIAPGDGFLYRACTDRVQIIDLADPTAPVVVGDYYYPDREWPVTYVYLALAVSDNTLFLGAFDLFLLDITDRTGPVLLSQTDTPHLVADIEIRDTLAVIAGTSNSQPAVYSALLLYNWTNLGELELVGRLEKRGELLDVTLSGDYAILAGGPTGAAAVDISDPTDPYAIWCIAPIGEDNNVGEALTVEAYDSLLIIVNWAPSLLYTWPTVSTMCDSTATLHPDGAFVGDMLLYDISDPETPAQLGILPHPGYVTDICVEGDLAIVADETRGIAIVDISHPGTLREVSIVPDLEQCSAVAAKGSFAFVYELFHGLHTLNISNPAKPIKLTTLQLGGYVQEMTVHRDSLYIAAGGVGVLVIDISNPRHPILRDTWRTADFACDVLASDHHLYVADRYAGLQVIDLNAPASHTTDPEFPHDGSPSWIIFLAKEADRLYAAGGGYVDILDVTVPESPKLIEQIAPSSIRDVAAYNNLLYVCRDWSGLGVYDMLAPGDTLVQVAEHDTPGMAYKAIVHDGQLYVADFLSLLRFRLPVPTNVDDTSTSRGLLPGAYRLHPNHPNPFNPSTIIEYDLPQSSPTTLTIYNIMGQRVRTLTNKHQSAGHHTVTWDGRDSHGNILASGVYFYRMTSGAISHTKKMLLLK